MKKVDAEHLKTMVGMDVPVSLVTGVGMKDFNIAEVRFYWGAAQRKIIEQAEESTLAFNLRLVSAVLAKLLVLMDRERIEVRSEGVQSLLDSYGLIVKKDLHAEKVMLIPVDLSEGGNDGKRTGEKPGTPEERGRGAGFEGDALEHRPGDNRPRLPGF